MESKSGIKEFSCLFPSIPALLAFNDSNRTNMRNVGDRIN